MRTKPIFYMLSALVFFTACNGDSDNNIRDEYINTRNFVFDTAIDPSTLTQEDSSNIYSNVTEFAPSPESFLIESSEDLDLFNQSQIQDEDEWISLGDLDSHTFFFIRDPGCPDYFDYSNHSYSNNILTIILDHFHEPDVVCPVIISELYIVFKASKSY